MTKFTDGKDGSLNATLMTITGTTVSGKATMDVKNSDGTEFWKDTANVTSTTVTGTQTAPTTVVSKRTDSNDSTVHWTLQAYKSTTAVMDAGGGGGTPDGTVTLVPKLTIGTQTLTVSVTLPTR